MQLSSVIDHSDMSYETAKQKILGLRTASVGSVFMELPALAGSGNSISLTVSTLHSPKDVGGITIHVFATLNPRPHSLTAHFSNAAPKAELKTKIRLGASQDVVVFAEYEDGRLFTTSSYIDVTVGACESLGYLP